MLKATIIFALLFSLQNFNVFANELYPDGKELTQKDIFSEDRINEMRELNLIKNNVTLNKLEFNFNNSTILFNNIKINNTSLPIDIWTSPGGESSISIYLLKKEKKTNWFNFSYLENDIDFFCKQKHSNKKSDIYQKCINDSLNKDQFFLFYDPLNQTYYFLYHDYALTDSPFMEPISIMKIDSRGVTYDIGHIMANHSKGSASFDEYKNTGLSLYKDIEKLYIGNDGKLRFILQSKDEKEKYQFYSDFNLETKLIEFDTPSNVPCFPTWLPEKIKSNNVDSCDINTPKMRGKD